MPTQIVWDTTGQDIVGQHPTGVFRVARNGDPDLAVERGHTASIVARRYPVGSITTSGPVLYIGELAYIVCGRAVSNIHGDIDAALAACAIAIFERCQQVANSFSVEGERG